MTEGQISAGIGMARIFVGRPGTLTDSAVKAKLASVSAKIEANSAAIIAGRDLSGQLTNEVIDIVLTTIVKNRSASAK